MEVQWLQAEPVRGRRQEGEEGKATALRCLERPSQGAGVPRLWKGAWALGLPVCRPGDKPGGVPLHFACLVGGCALTLLAVGEQRASEGGHGRSAEGATRPGDKAGVGNTAPA